MKIRDYGNLQTSRLRGSRDIGNLARMEIRENGKSRIWKFDKMKIREYVNLRISRLRGSRVRRFRDWDIGNLARMEIREIGKSRIWKFANMEIR